MHILKLALYGGLTLLFVLLYPVTPSLFLHQQFPSSVPLAADPLERSAPTGAEVDLIARLIQGYCPQLPSTQRQRIAEAVLASGRRHDVDPRLVASVIIVESRGNASAVSSANSVGIMQIHVPTWAAVADLESLNLFDVEQNIDLGTRILRHYISRHGMWKGIARYKGGDTVDDPVEAYVERVQRIYSGRSTPIT